MNTETYCPLPWNHFSVGTEGNMRVCCNSGNLGIIEKDGSPIKITEVESPLQYYNTLQLKNLRSTLLKGERSKECKLCYDIEDSGGKSVRQTLVEKWPLDNFLKNTNTATGEITNPSINYLDFSWSNKCNLKCKMCSPFSSDQLIEESKKFNLYPNLQEKFTLGSEIWASNNTLDIITKLVSHDLTDVLVTGGEPLINNNFYEFCKFLIDNGYSKNLSLAFHSNLTVTPTKWFDIWPHFQYVIIRASIDAVGTDYEYVRYPGKWNIVKKNIEEIVDFINNNNSEASISIEFHTVLSLFNFAAIPDLIDYLFTFSESGFVRSMPLTNYIHWPNHARINLIPLKHRLIIVQSIKDSIDRNRIKIKNPKSNRNADFLLSLLKIAMQDVNPDLKENIKQTFETLINIDKDRGQDTYKFLPWLKELEGNNFNLTE
jgi:sulfatase maturation enzyme AslB (radical SAM superfamily)